jgi:hypothetical protein
MRRSVRTGLAAAIVATTLGAQGASLAAEPITWVGRTRDEVVALLGRPDKSKKAKNAKKAKGDKDGRVLVYNVYRLAEGAVVEGGVVVFDLEGVGTVARPRLAAVPSEAAVAVEPIELDAEGRRTGGGVGRSETYSRSIALGKDDPDPQPRGGGLPAHEGKLKLSLVVNGEGRVESWDVSPKPREGDD